MAVVGMRKSAVVSDSVMAVPKTSTRNSAARRDLERPLGTKDMWQTNAKKNGKILMVTVVTMSKHLENQGFGGCFD
jgi:hypothetical protein